MNPEPILKAFYLVLYLLPGFIFCWLCGLWRPKISWGEVLIVSSFFSLTLETIIALVQTSFFGVVDVKLILSSIYLTNSLVLFLAGFKIIVYAKTHLHR